MLTRWDMVAHPPDILVTNYSMLNAMLMRDIEEPHVRRRPRTGSRPTTSNVLSLVVDELHLYRGTQGSEVAMIVRNLLSRLGRRARLSSAPLHRYQRVPHRTTGGFDYLEQFFGVDRDSFFVTAGRAADARRATLPISRSRGPETWNGADPDAASCRPCARASISRPRLRCACTDERGSVRADTARPRLPSNLFDEPDDDGAGARGGARGARRDGARPDRFRCAAHMFARTLRGIWACTNPDCDQVERNGALGVGRLFSIPASTCPCGGRVLELLYCFECGDISLGGYVAGELDGAVFLTPAPVEVPPERAAPVFMRRTRRSTAGTDRDR